jgi:hypothetical protein
MHSPTSREENSPSINMSSELSTHPMNNLGQAKKFKSKFIEYMMYIIYINLIFTLVIVELNSGLASGAISNKDKSYIPIDYNSNSLLDKNHNGAISIPELIDHPGDHGLEAFWCYLSHTMWGANLDSDHDGLVDFDEKYVFGTNPYKSDCDPEPWKFDYGFNSDFDGWELTGTAVQWPGNTLESDNKWYDHWAGAQGVIVLDGAYLPRAGINASPGIIKTIHLPISAKLVTFKVVKEDHDGGFRADLIDPNGERHILGEQILYGGDQKTMTYDISQWAGKAVTLGAWAFGAGTDASRCGDADAGKCCWEFMGIDSIQITLCGGREIP